MGFGIELSGVTKRFPTPEGEAVVAIDSVELRVEPGEALGLMGPSGSGKSTLLHVIGAMEGPDHGTVRVAGLEVNALPRRDQARYRRTIGFVFQRFHLLAALNVLDNVVAPVLPYRTNYDKFSRATQLLKDVGLGHKERSLPSRLSGGEQQRVAIARALINDPGLLLADEPTGNLDSVTGGEIVQLLLDLRARRGMTLVVATHDPGVASRCDRIVRLRDGRIIEDFAVPHDARADEIFERVTRLDPGS